MARREDPHSANHFHLKVKVSELISRFTGSYAPLHAPTGVHNVVGELLSQYMCCFSVNGGAALSRTLPKPGAVAASIDASSPETGSRERKAYLKCGAALVHFSEISLKITPKRNRQAEECFSQRLGLSSGGSALL